MAGRHLVTSPIYCASVSGYPTELTVSATQNIFLSVTPSGTGTVSAVSLFPGDGSGPITLTQSATTWDGSVSYSAAGFYSPSVVVSYTETSTQTTVKLDSITVS